MTKRDEQAREYAEESGSLDGYHPTVRDFILGQGCFSQENEAEMHRRVGRKLGERVAKAMTDAVMEAFGMIPKSASSSPAVEPENKGNGMRTERVTLEITHSVPVGRWDWTNILETYRPGESVRVVEETHFDDLAQVAMERDAAIRERDKLRAEQITQALTADRFATAVQEADTLRTRVAELESQLESVACRAATAETALEADNKRLRQRPPFTGHPDDK